MRQMAFFRVLIMLVWVSLSLEIQLILDSSTKLGPLPHFWTSTGFCPPKPHDASEGFDLGLDMQYNLAMIGAIPNRGIEQVRIHWLLDLVKVVGQSQNPSQPPMYNFQYLDNLIDLLYKNGLRPGFELMGNPGQIFTNFEFKPSIIYWKELVFQVAKRYIDMYGIGVVMDWNFETWNEPDCHDFDTVNMTVQGYLNYYDACSEGLKAASPFLKLGGPSDGCKRSNYSDALLEHVVNGTNFFTGEKGVRMDFLSYHKKGKGFSKNILEDEITLMSQISQRYPSLANKPFFNDEADPLVGWWRDKEWRADTRYAAMVTKVIAQHQNTMFSSLFPPIRNYTLLSNDNAFLSWYPHQFTQRTLLARLQINTTSPHHTQFYQKPVYTVMGMLARLGETQVHAAFSDDANDPMPDDVGVLSSVHIPEINGSSDSWQMSSLVYLSNDTGPQIRHIQFDLYTNVTPPVWASQEMVIVVWLLDNAVGNPYSIWVKEGMPDYPTLEQMHRIRMQEGAQFMYRGRLKVGYQPIGRYSLYEPAVMLVHVCTQPDSVPDQVTNVNMLNITWNQVLITWSDDCVNSRCTWYYEVAFSKTGKDNSYMTIYPLDNDGLKFTSNSFVYSLAPSGNTTEDVTGFYKVRAADYFGSHGEYSLPAQYP